MNFLRRHLATRARHSASSGLQAGSADLGSQSNLANVGVQNSSRQNPQMWQPTSATGQNLDWQPSAAMPFSAATALASVAPGAGTNSHTADAHRSALGSMGLSLVEQRALAPLMPFLTLPGLRDLLVQERDSETQIWVDIGDGLQLLPGSELAVSELRNLAVQLLEAGGRQLDELQPAADTQLGAGLRVHAVLRPAAASGTAISIRVPAATQLEFRDLVAGGLCDKETAHALAQAIAKRKNILISGGTGTGKTTLLRALLNLVPHEQRIITIEDVAELRLNHPHHVALETRKANAENSGELSLAELLRQALRMRPDRLVLGECRGAELATLLTALNTGHNGGAGTLHASSLKDVAARIEALGALAGLSEKAVAKQFVAAVHTVVQLERTGGKHRIAALGTPKLDDALLLEIVAGHTT